MIGRPVPPPRGSQPRSSRPSSVGAMGIAEPGGPLVPLRVERRAAGPRDVLIDIEFCGLCHSDVHAGRGEWGARTLPLVPGHEIVGIVRTVGPEADDFRVGDRVGVGCLVDSCRDCEQCDAGLEQFCGASVGTYGARNTRTGEYTQGGYASSIVVDCAYVLRIPDGLDPAAAAPLLCAGITTYSPMRHYGVAAGDRIGVLGLGGLGHTAVKIGAAMGADVTVFTSKESKRAAALELGAARVVVTGDQEAMAEASDTLSLLIDTVAAPHDLGPFLATLRRDGALIQLGLPSGPMPPVDVGRLISRRLRYGGSLIGGIAETQEMLDFCAEHGVVCDVEVVGADALNTAWDRMVAGDVQYRFVLDAGTLRATN
ncbi:putative zinc-type alcohol dehydrogenase-like protein [Paeniglutamicibacter cryotolerans]|uniref:alcohol dehydrogenase (NADP(+)) n=2 Tax=Paeniglutamicibacter cryotolerans TaxID=670079 RepID=A0A839QNY8_9MICC|nr:NAD(P)-dependent alcohol dehydrogenase [Paeniglutamicibacter cryotolerans]MBB2996355.1 putative zinc-type alcohol dehydrogenase-like protein [Paeniglutamicibacter cryotolerans]